MGAPERKLINEILKNLPKNKRLFRINAGTGWTGEVVRKTENSITLKNPRIFHGAPTGWPDLAGWETVEITPEMVGQKIAVFVAEEVKATGGLSKIQKLFRDTLENMGGIFRVVKSDPQAPR
jgi:hypothetical protein